MHDDVKEAFEQIDAALFTSDTFYNRHDRNTLKMWCERWLRETNRLQQVEDAYVAGTSRSNL